MIGNYIKVVTKQDKEDLRQYFRKHWNDGYYLKIKTIVKDWISHNKLTFNPKQFNGFLTGEIKRLHAAGKITKHSNHIWRVIKEVTVNE